MPQNCHSEEWSDEESGVGLPGVSLDRPPQTPRCTRGDMQWRLLRQSPQEGIKGRLCMARGQVPVKMHVLSLQGIILKGQVGIAQEDSTPRGRKGAVNGEAGDDVFPSRLCVSA